jgi:hypothetical protein
MRLHRLLPLLILALTALPPASSAGLAPNPRNIQLNASAGYLGFKQYDTSVGAWQGADIAGGVTWSVHQSLAITGNLAHGIPTKSEDGHLTIARLQGQLRLFPALGQPPGRDGIFASAGPMWMGQKTLREWSGLNTQLTASHLFNDVLFGYVMYAHGFAWSQAASTGDRDFLRVGLGIGSSLGR